MIVDRARQHVLLTLHAKLGKWLQLGGHCDGIRDPFFVAWKEAYEESGLKHVRPVSDRIFDIGIHSIPAHNGVPSHLHYDIRYLFLADPNEPLEISSESKDLRWVPLSAFADFVDDSGLLSMRDKILSSKGDFP